MPQYPQIQRQQDRTDGQIIVVWRTAEDAQRFSGGVPFRKGTVVRCPWREFGDDQDLTGEVITIDRKGLTVRWHGNGSVTPEGDESVFQTAEQIARLDVVSY